VLTYEPRVDYYGRFETERDASGYNRKAECKVSTVCFVRNLAANFAGC